MGDETMEVLFRRAPGIVYDLSQIFVTKLNDKSKWINRVIDIESKESDVNYIEFWRDQFADPDPVLAVFFYLKNENAQTYFSQIFNTVIDYSGEMVSKEDFLTYFSMDSRVKREVLEFYLGEEFDINNLREIAAKINANSEYDNDFKLLLLSFVINCDQVLDKMRTTFSRYYDQAEAIFEERANELLKRQEELNMSDVCTYIVDTVKKRGRRKELRRSVVSMTLFSKYTFWYTNRNETGWFVIGEFYGQEKRVQDIEPKLDMSVFGTSMGDKNRAGIIKLLLENDELNSSEIAIKLNVAINTIAYHLDIMKTAKILAHHNEGKTAYYSINTVTCEKAKEQIMEWILGENL